MQETRWVASGACSACPYSWRCHEARQRAVDPTGLGRHTSCDFYREYERRATAPPASTRGVLRELMNLWRRVW